MDKTLVSLVVLCGLAVSVVGQKTPQDGRLFQEQFKSEYFEVGDPRLCMEVDRDAKFPVNRFEVLPGIGWDNLQNVAKGQVIQFNYSRCMSTDDGKFLIPDQVFTIPLKESFVDTFAEIIDTWHNTSSTTSSSINVNAGLHFSFASISGSFSREHTQIKDKQIEDKAITVRVQLRYERYKSQLQPDATLHPAFKRRLLNIAAHKELNQTNRARYEAQLVVRDFGTHIQTSVTAGAGLVKTDFLKRDYVATQFEDKTKIVVSASASFGSFFHMGGSYQHSTDTKDYQSYLKSMTHSFVTSHGGPLMRPFNMTPDAWIKGLDINLVPMDISGDPLSFLVTTQTLPELPPDLVNQVEKILREAITQYYEMNTHSGCTKMGSPNFSFSANFDDGSCEAKATNMTFGGIFQMCSVSGEYLNHNPCSGLDQVNPKTRSYSCPPSYTAVKLVTGHKTGAPEYQRKCNSCGLFGLFHCCHTNTYVATAVYTAYWCAAVGHVTPDSGYLFGGIYSSTQDNAVTGAKACPPSFYPRLFLEEELCISDDFELGMAYSVPFGGFMSCSVGNPLSMPGVHPVGLTAEAPKPNSLHAFMADDSNSNNPSRWPKHCPKGYSQHLATIEQGCEIRYCLKSGSLRGPNLPRVKLPPFNAKPTTPGERTTHVMFNPKTQEWIQDRQDFDEKFGSNKLTWSSLWSPAVGSQGGNRGPSSGMSPEVAAGTSGGNRGSSSGMSPEVTAGTSGGNRGSSSGMSPEVAAGTSGGNRGPSSGMSPDVAAVIGGMVTMLCGVVALAVYTKWKRRRQYQSTRLDDTQRLAEDDGMASQPGVSYGALNTQSNVSVAVNLPTDA